jgi:hypothetical protein
MTAPGDEARRHAVPGYSVMRFARSIGQAKQDRKDDTISEGANAPTITKRDQKNLIYRQIICSCSNA